MALTEYETTGVVTNGQLTIRNRRALNLALAAFKDGDVLVRIERKRAARSQQQNRYWWGVCVQLVSDHTGYSPEEIHEIAKQMFLPKRLAVADGNGEICGEYVIGGSSAKLDTAGFTEFVERYRQWAAETLGVEIPDPV